MVSELTHSSLEASKYSLIFGHYLYTFTIFIILLYWYFNVYIRFTIFFHKLCYQSISKKNLYLFIKAKSFDSPKKQVWLLQWTNRLVTLLRIWNLQVITRIQSSFLQLMWENLKIVSLFGIVVSWVVVFIPLLSWNNYFLFHFQNGGFKRYGGINYPLKGQKGQLFEGATRGVAFVHSPFLAKNSGTVNNKWV